MLGILKALKYSLLYIALIIAFYFIGIAYCYKLDFRLLAIIPINYLAIKYGILIPIKKERFVDKYYILMSLVVFTSIFNTVFLYLMHINVWVIVICVILNIVELIYLDLPGKKVFGFEIVDSSKRK